MGLGDETVAKTSNARKKPGTTGPSGKKVVYMGTVDGVKVFRFRKPKPKPRAKPKELD